MPIHNIGFHLQPPGQQPSSPRPFPKGLFEIGPVLPVQVDVPRKLAELLQSQGQPLPQSVRGLALIDTGATRTAVDESVVQQLGVQPMGIANVGTAAGVQQQSMYSARLSFPGTPLPGMDFAQILSVNLSGHAVPQLKDRLIVLIGRDILARFVMIYNGPHASVTLAF